VPNVSRSRSTHGKYQKYTEFFGKPEGRKLLEQLGVDTIIILKETGCQGIN
jgi:hypothetical protein